MARGRFMLAGTLLIALISPAFGNEKAAREFIESRKASAGQLKALTDDSLNKAMPGRSCFALLFRQFPIGIAPPEGFSESNLVTVDTKGKVTLVPTNKDLQAFAKSSFLARDEAQGKIAAQAWLLLSSELSQDGFYKFQVIPESLKAVKDGEKLLASGRLVVMQGGNGEISVQLVFDATGKLSDIKETTKLVAGPRPICQATKLLDPDPLVRKICEADLLIMGEAAREYLLEQRARGTPALQTEIDRVWQRIQRGER